MTTTPSPSRVLSTMGSFFRFIGFSEYQVIWAKEPTTTYARIAPTVPSCLPYWAEWDSMKAWVLSLIAACWVFDGQSAMQLWEYKLKTGVLESITEFWRRILRCSRFLWLLVCRQKHWTGNGHVAWIESNSGLIQLHSKHAHAYKNCEPYLRKRRDWSTLMSLVERAETRLIYTLLHRHGDPLFRQMSPCLRGRFYDCFLAPCLRLHLLGWLCSRAVFLGSGLVSVLVLRLPSPLILHASMKDGH